MIRSTANWFGHAGFNSGYLIVLASKTCGDGLVLMVNSVPADMTTSDIPKLLFVTEAINRIASDQHWLTDPILMLQRVEIHPCSGCHRHWTRLRLRDAVLIRLVLATPLAHRQRAAARAAVRLSQQCCLLQQLFDTGINTSVGGDPIITFSRGIVIERIEGL